MKNPIENLNKNFDSRVRLGIMSALMVNTEVNFNDLKELIQVTDGNLASHIKSLEENGYIKVQKGFIGRKTNTPIWGTTARRLMINVVVPMATGGIFLLALIKNGVYEFTAPGCLVFYGLAVLNASKYTFSETVYLSYSLLLLGIINLWFTEYSIYFWALGFGVFHIIYGTAMWWKHER